MAEKKVCESYPLLLIPLLLLTLLPLSLTTFLPSDNYLLSCGSSSPLKLDDGRIFSPDDSSLSPSSSLSLSKNDTDTATATATSPSLLSSARVFLHTSTYSLPISSSSSSSSSGGPHLLRLHFSPFLNLSSATFTISANGFPLLTNFSTSVTILKEFFFFTLAFPALLLSFHPSSPSSFAFVNAVEFFSVPDSLFSATATPVPISLDDPGDGLSTHVLETVYRVNVGGPTVTPRNDTLWRSWAPDDGLIENGDVTKEVRFSGRVRYPDGGATRETAPESVYGTAREMNKKGNAPIFCLSS